MIQVAFVFGIIIDSHGDFYTMPEMFNLGKIKFHGYINTSSHQNNNQ